MTKIGPFEQFGFDDAALQRLGRMMQRGRDAEARFLAAACVEIRDRGAEALAGHLPNLFDVHRGAYILSISVTSGGQAATVLDFYHSP